jgi:hypothetical protein
MTINVMELELEIHLPLQWRPLYSIIIKKCALPLMSLIVAKRRFNPSLMFVSKATRFIPECPIFETKVQCYKTFLSVIYEF